MWVGLQGALKLLGAAELAELNKNTFGNNRRRQRYDTPHCSSPETFTVSANFCSFWAFVILSPFSQPLELWVSASSVLQPLHYLPIPIPMPISSPNPLELSFCLISRAATCNYTKDTEGYSRQGGTGLEEDIGG